METEKLPYNIELAKKMTDIDDENLLKFYMNAVIGKISKILGYNIILSQNKHSLSGVCKEYTYVVARPLKSILRVMFNNNDITDRCKIESDRKILLDFNLCCDESIQVEYMAGYEELPPEIQMFIFSQVASMKMETQTSGLSSYSIESISYSFLDQVTKNSDFINSIQGLFGGSI